MFDHVKLGVSDYAAGKAFFSYAIAVIGPDGHNIEAVRHEPAA